VLVGVGERWLSWPYRLPAAGAPQVAVAADREAWRVEQAPAAASLAFKGEAVPLPPVKPSDATCRPPLAPLDPDGVGVYLVARKERFDERCRDGLLLYPPGAQDQARCVAREAFEAIGADGLPIYMVRRSQGSADAPDFRRAVPDASTRDTEGQCQLVSTRLNDDLLASKPCGEAAAPAWYGPDGEIVFACSQEYRRRDGTPLDLHGATLVRLGEGGTALVRLPWGMLGVVGPDGKGREVGGLPLGAGQAAPPSAAVRDGFLVAVATGVRSPAELGAPAALELFHVSFEGAAESRGAYPPLGRDEDLARRLGPDGALYTVPSSMGAGTVTRWVVGEAPRVLFDSWKQKPDDRAELQPLLLGWRAAAPGRTEGRPVKPYEAPPQKQALAAYALADPAALPCKAPLDRLDPERVWIRLHGWVFDPLDPTRFAWSEENAYQTVELKIGGDGRLLTLRQDLATSAPVERRIEALATAAGELRPGGGGCVTFAGSSPAPRVGGGSCGERVEAKGPWAPVPGSSEAAIQCAAAWPKRETRVGEVTLPEGLFLVHAGTGGRLLFGSRSRGSRFAHDPQPVDRWLLALADGRQVPLTGVPQLVHAIRAAPDGFLLVAPAPPEPQSSRKKPPPPPPARTSALSRPPPPPQPPLALFLLTDDGRLRTLGTYPGLPGDAGVEDLALAADRSLHAVLFRYNAGIREVRLPLGGKELEVEWETKTQISANVMELLTGP
jgi:hypothetical protein